MAVEPFKIINDDGTTNQSEYNRCIQFLNDYVAGNINVYPPITWANPYEIDMSREESALVLIRDCLNYESNKLFTPAAWKNFKNLFTGIIERYGSTIHTCGNYLESSANFQDGPGYMYDVFTDINEDSAQVKSKVLNDDITIYYLDDKNHTVLEYNDSEYANETLLVAKPSVNFPSFNIYATRYLTSNVTNYPGVYKGYLSGVYSDFQRLAGQYVGSSTLFYYSECNDSLYTSGLRNRTDDHINEYMQFGYRSVYSNKATPAQGLSLNRVSQLQTLIYDIHSPNAYINPNSWNTEFSYISPTQLTAAEPEEWYI